MLLLSLRHRSNTRAGIAYTPRAPARFFLSPQTTRATPLRGSAGSGRQSKDCSSSASLCSALRGSRAEKPQGKKIYFRRLRAFHKIFCPRGAHVAAADDCQGECPVTNPRRKPNHVWSLGEAEYRNYVNPRNVRNVLPEGAKGFLRGGIPHLCLYPYFSCDREKHDLKEPGAISLMTFSEGGAGGKPLFGLQRAVSPQHDQHQRRR